MTCFLITAYRREESWDAAAQRGGPECCWSPKDERCCKTGPFASSTSPTTGNNISDLSAVFYKINKCLYINSNITKTLLEDNLQLRDAWYMPEVSKAWKWRIWHTRHTTGFLFPPVAVERLWSLCNKIHTLNNHDYFDYNSWFWPVGSPDTYSD